MMTMYSVITLLWCISCIAASTVDATSVFTPKYLTDALVKSLDVRCILSDVDGTLLPHHSEISDESIEAIQKILSEGYPFYPCTGRTRLSMVNALGTRFVNLFGDKIEDIPGVYQQGLLVYGKSGNLIYEENLNQDVIADVVSFCDRYNLPVLAYCGERVFCRKRCRQTDKITTYSDPVPLECPEGLTTLKSKGISTNKMIIVEEDIVLSQYRQELETEFQGRISVTKAVSGLLEILPHGSSKGTGVKVLLDHFNISHDHVMAFGDGENGSYIAEN